MFLIGLIFASQASAETVMRSNLIVSNLSCISCLSNIEAELKTLPGILGMDTELQTGRVTVDHLASLDGENIAARISKLGYPAAVDWTATIPDQYTRRFSNPNSPNSNCSGRGCGGFGGSSIDLNAWRAAPASGIINRTTLQVSNLTCSSCLASIAAALQQMPETFGMKGYLSRGVIIVDHTPSLDNSRIAAAITNLGYPARIVALNDVPAPKAFSSGGRGKRLPQNTLRTGSSCNSRGPCNATVDSWQKLYQRYFSRTDPE